MKCQYCGSELPDGAVYCEHCGKPVQIVPDYNMFEDDVLPSIVSGQKAGEAKTGQPASGRSGQGATDRSGGYVSRQGETGTDRTEPTEGKNRTETGSGRPGKSRKEKPVSKTKMILCCAAIAALALVLFLAFYLNTPGYQKNAGDRAYAGGNYTAAVSYYTRAYSVHDTDADIAAALGDCYVKLKDNENAGKYYQAALASDAENERAFAGLCELYAETQNYDGLNQLKAAAITAAQQKAIEGAYISEVVFSEEGGDYDDDLALSLSSPEGYSIYYTTNGKDPEPDSADLFEADQPIKITDGETTVRARAVSDSGSLGPVTEQIYKVSYAAPDYPKVSPDGGEFAAPTQVTISYAKDEEAKIYYTWDGSDPTALSSRYTGPLDIPEGNNILSVIVVDSHDLSSGVYRCNFVYLPDGAEAGAESAE